MKTRDEFLVAAVLLWVLDAEGLIRDRRHAVLGRNGASGNTRRLVFCSRQVLIVAVDLACNATMKTRMLAEKTPIFHKDDEDTDVSKEKLLDIS
jgi:hypothetical protein